MALADLTRIVERLRQTRAAGRARMAKASLEEHTPEKRLELTYQPGERLVDLATGEIVEVTSGQRATVIVPTPRQ